MLALVRVLGVTVWDYHFSKRKSVKDIPDVALVVVGDVVQDNTLAIVEAHMDAPVLPFDRPSLDAERDALRLGDVDRLKVCPVPAFFLNRGLVVVVWLRFAERSSHGWDINVDDLFRLCIVDRAEVQWECVLRIINVGPVIHQSLLQTNVGTESLVVTDSPRCELLISIRS